MSISPILRECLSNAPSSEQPRCRCLALLQGEHGGYRRQAFGRSRLPGLRGRAITRDVIRSRAGRGGGAGEVTDAFPDPHYLANAT